MTPSHHRSSEPTRNGATKGALPVPGAIAFIGGGNVARSMIGGLVALGTPASCIRVSEPDDHLRAALCRDFGVLAHPSNHGAVAQADLWVLAVKPQVLRGVCEELAATAREARPLVVTLAAGIPIAAVERWLGAGDEPLSIVRAMPNTPALLGESATALCANAQVSAIERQHAQALFEAVGIALWIADEDLMDTVTATSGSGPAYVFAMVEAMQAAAVAQGLPEEVARALIAQTIVGAGRMLVDSGEDAATLRRRVTSPGGVTAEALRRFAEGGFEALVAEGIAAATARGAELAAQYGA